VEGNADPWMMFMGRRQQSNPRQPESDEFTVRQFAKREQVSERTVRRWIEKDALIARKTAGGQYRIKGTR
jgi:excisionase family DNA binding protein